MRTRPTLFALAAALLAGCGGAQSPAMPQAPSATAQAHNRSWMLPEAKAEDLIYLADDYSTVYVYSFPKGKLVGEMTDFSAPFYLCSDASGDVFIPNSIGPKGLYEYAHAGTEPINVFRIPAATNSCSVDPSTGNLAVAPVHSPSLYIFPKAQPGAPTEYTDSNIYYTADIVYDNSGNLFLDGLLRNDYLFLLELPSGSKSFETINTSSIMYGLPGQSFQPMLWDGKYLDIATQPILQARRVVLDRLAIAGSDATLEGTVPLAKQPSGTYPQFSIYKTTAVGLADLHHSGKFGFFTYPRGRLTKKVHVSQDALWGVTLSFAPSRSRTYRQ